MTADMENGSRAGTGSAKKKKTVAWVSTDGTRYYVGETLRSMYVDEYGDPVKKTKHSHPHSYDGFVVWRGGENGESSDTVYSDRLLQWDFDKHDRLCMKHFGNRGQYWSDRDPKKIEAFLRDWTGDIGLRLILVMQYCNAGSGYPCWRFDFAYSSGPSVSEES